MRRAARGEPKRLESPMDASDACTRTQNIADDSTRPTDNSKGIRIPQNGFKRSNSPARSQEPRPKKLQRLSDDADASGTGTHGQRNQTDAKTTTKMAKVISTPPDKQKRNLTHLLE